MPVVLQSLYVDLADDKLFFHRETGRFGKQVAVLGYDPVTGKDEVGARFAEAGRGVDIACHATGGLLADQRTQVGVLADQLVAGGEVEDDVGSFHRQQGTGGDGNPEVFAYLDAGSQPSRTEQQVAAHRIFFFPDGNCRFPKFRGRCEPALFLKLFIVGQICLGDDTPYGSFLEDNGGIDQPVFRP